MTAVDARSGTSTTTALPLWDMTPIFPALDGEAFGEAFTSVVGSIADLRDHFDRHGVRQQAAATVDDATVAAFEEVTDRLNAVSEDLRTVYAYLSAFVSTDSRHDAAQARLSELQQHVAELRKLSTRYEAWLGSLDVEALIGCSELAGRHAFPLRKAVVAARHQMGEAEEDLAASLEVSSSRAWAKLHDDVTSQLTVAVHFPSDNEDGRGHVEELPMSAVRGLAYDANPRVRRAAHEAEIKGWERVAVPLAAAMNGIKGESNTLNGRRGWADSVEPALFINNIDRATLDAMHEACRESFPDFRRYLQSKARLLLGRERLPWWDLFAPAGGSDSREWSFDEAASFVVAQFGTFSPRLADLAARAIREGWVDAEPRNGKRDGAFCMGVRRDESRVFLNYKPSFASVSTLAHELGHAYHNVQLAPRTPLQRSYPMALAETASIFCQTIVTTAAIGQTSGGEQLEILENELQSACQVVVDIHSRFLFEQRVFERRQQRDLSVNELNALMLEAQRETYGDGLDLETLHPYMWAVKGHYYSTSRPYYNWPYTFGFLFGLGLYARFREDPDRFRAGYDDLLSAAGMDSAAALAQRFGIDIRSAGFWRASLDICRDQVRQFETLAGG